MVLTGWGSEICGCFRFALYAGNLHNDLNRFVSGMTGTDIIRSVWICHGNTFIHDFVPVCRNFYGAMDFVI